MKFRLVFYFLLIVTIFSGVFYFKDILWPPTPCSEVLEFSIGNFDERFGLSRAQFIDYVEQAARNWEEAAGKELFRYSAIGNLKINLIYDERQELTDGFEKYSNNINKDKENFLVLKSRYDSLVIVYDQEKIDYEKRLADLQARRQTYNEKVNLINKSGGASSKDYKDLKVENDSINNDFNLLNKSKDNLNYLVNQINEIQPTLNDLASKYNVKVRDYNLATSLSREEFTEGDYTFDHKGQNINIYQFDNVDELVILLTHELGHALGLEHVEDASATMYYLNNNKNARVNDADKLELKRVCTVLSE